MILRMATENFDMGEELSKYARNKLDGIERLIPRKDRPTTLVEVTFSEQKGKTPLRTCQLSVKLRREELVVRETTQHIYAALDVAVAEIEQQLKSFRRQAPGVFRTYVRKTVKRTLKFRSK